MIDIKAIRIERQVLNTTTRSIRMIFSSRISFVIFVREEAGWKYSVQDLIWVLWSLLHDFEAVTEQFTCVYKRVSIKFPSNFFINVKLTENSFRPCKVQDTFNGSLSRVNVLQIQNVWGFQVFTYIFWTKVQEAAKGFGIWFKKISKVHKGSRQKRQSFWFKKILETEKDLVFG